MNATVTLPARLAARFLTSAALLLFPMHGQTEIDPILLLESEAAVKVLLQDSGLDRLHPPVATEQKIFTDANVDFLKVKLGMKTTAPVELLIRGPHNFHKEKTSPSRVLFLVSGLFEGKSSIRLIDPVPGLVVVGIDYSYGLQDLLKGPQYFYRFVRETPIQIAGALQWLTNQSWVDKKNLVSMGVSLGGLFLPASLHMAQKLDVSSHGTIFAFTGGTLEPVLIRAFATSVAPEILQPTVAVIAGLTSLHAPRLHVPFLPGHFLLLSADEDQIFPSSSTEALSELIPKPRLIRTLHGPHIDPNQVDLILQTRKAILDWMESAL